ncbi:MAG TPA: hypothetical protein VHI51_15640, partial [Ktedonobacterales bacterium]|nr:hypothetical protein [Ktedonobacterales bacterium]
MADSSRRRRKQKRWWTTPLGWVVTIAGMFAAIPPGSYVTDHLQPLAAPIVWAALALGAVSILGYFRFHLNGWLVCALAGFTLGLAFGVSLIEGWGAQVQVALDVAKVALLVGSVAVIIGVIDFSVRMSRRVYAPLREGLREIGEQIHTDALFRDDGERIVVYPRRWRLLRLIVGQVVFVVACALGVWWAMSNAANPIVTIGLGFFLALIAFILLLNLVRLIIPGPTLIIGPDGVLDRGSQIVTGRGLLRWDELIAVSEYTYKANMLSPTNRWLMILLTDARAVRDR